MNDLRPLNRLYRLGTVTAVALAVVLFAVVTAAPGSGRANRAGPLAGAPAPIGSGGPDATTAPGALSPGTGRPDVATSPAGSGRLAPGTDPGGATLPGGSGTGPPAAGTGETPVPAAGPSDQGVTASSITIAFTRIDPAYGEKFGIPDAHDTEAIQSYTDDINARGGINGRRIRAVVITQSDPRYPDYGQQTCRSAFVDYRAFMMIDNSRWPGTNECAARLGRPIVDPGQGELAATSRSFINGLGGLYWAGGMTSEQIVKIWVGYVRARLGGPQKVGIIKHYNPDLGAAADVLARDLVAAGFPKPSVFQHTEDASTAAVQAANVAAQFQRDGVKLVMPVTNAVAVGLLQRGFSSRNYHPRWTFSPLGGLDFTDLAVAYDNSQFNGATGISYARLPDQPGQERCAQIFRSRYPQYEYGSGPAIWCHEIFQTATVLARAGGQLTTRTFAQVYASLGRTGGNEWPVQSFGSTKFDGSDAVQVLRYNNGRMSSQSGFVTHF